MTTSTEPRFKSLDEIFEAKLSADEFIKATEEYHTWANYTEPRFKSLGEIFEAELPPEEFAKATEEYHTWADKQVGIYNDGTEVPGETSDKLKLVGTGVVGVGATMTAAGAGPFGAAVAAAGAVVIAAGHVAKMNGNDEMEDPEFEMYRADPLTGETADVDAVGNSDVTPIGRFPFWNVAETDVVTEAVGGHFFDNGGGELNSNPELSQVDSLTGETTTTENIGGMSGRVTFTGGTGTLQSWRNGQLVTGDTYANPADNNWAFENNTDSICEPETLSPVEFDVAAPLLTDQAVIGDQLKADPSGFCEDLRWVLPEQDLPFGCN